VRRSLALFFGLLALTAAWSLHLGRPALGQARKPQPLRTAGDRPVDIRHIRLDLKVDLSKKAVDARATINFRSLRRLSALPLDAVDFEVTAVALAQPKDQVFKTVPFTREERKVVIEFDPALPVDWDCTLRIDYRIRNPRAGLYFFGPTKEDPNVPLTVWSQGEPVTNRYWFPCLDHPNQRQTTELVVTVAAGNEVLSNGKLVSRKANPDKTVTFHWKQELPHVSYLVTLVVGQFDVVEEKWEQLPVQYYVPRGRKGDVARNFGKTRKMLEFFSKRFGIAYPWPKYAQVVVEQFTAGGMENTSATTLTKRALLDARAVLDGSAEGLIAHELGHQWWGDMVTCRDWAHLWLNEGFATYCEVLWAEHDRGADEAAYLLWGKGQIALARAKDRPVVDRHYPFPGSMFDARAYPKGGWVLHMLRKRLGEKVFWKGIQRYGTRHRLKCVETSDLRRTLEDVSGRSLERFFDDWTGRAGNPVVEVQTKYLYGKKQARLTIRQTQPGEAFHFPLTIAFQGAKYGKPVVVQPQVTAKQQSLYVPLPGRPERVDVDPEQTLLAEIKEIKSRELWLAQLTAAPNVALRIRAAAHLGQRKTTADRAALAKALQTEKFWGVQAEIAAALGEAGGPTCRDALLKGLAHAHPKVRRACAKNLAKFTGNAKVAGALKALLQKGDASYFVEAQALDTYAQLRQDDAVTTLLPWLGKPSYAEVLRTAALRALGKAQDVEALDTLAAWTKPGKPRACRAAALEALGRLGKSGKVDKGQLRRIVSALTAALQGDNVLVRRAAVLALRDLGRPASAALRALEAVRRNDPYERLRSLAKLAIAQIRRSTPVPDEIKRLRTEVERLKRDNEALRDRLDRVEKKGNP
jgi:aminopeptidase N